MDTEKYRKLFLEECREHLQVLNRELLNLESEGERFGGIDTIFREAHSVKGMSASMGYSSMVLLSHAMEDIFDGIRKETFRISPALTTLLFEGVDVLGQLTDEVDEKGDVSLSVDDLVGRLRSFVKAQGEAAAAPPPPPEIAEGDLDIGEEELPAAEIIDEGDAGSYRPGEEDRAEVLSRAREGETVYHCRVTISRDTASLSARSFVLIGKLNKVGSIIQSTPSLSEILEGKGGGTLEALVATARPEAELVSSINSVPELEEIIVEKVAVEKISPDEEEVALPAPEAEAVSAPVVEKKEAGKDASKRLIDQYLPRKSTTVRVDTRILDDLINIVGEMIINRDSLLALSRNREDEFMNAALDRLDLLVRNFQDTIMAVRMMPLEIVTDRLPRIVRDLARRSGKDVSFEIMGQGIELDRAILEEINDVLIHLVRNAIDHGVESIEDRRSAGKQERAVIRLSAGRERDWVWIAVEDDGRGMDGGRIRNAALQKGVITEAQAKGMDTQEMLQLICLPGFSTAAEVSDVSGRGVGMDVVKSKVDSFGGTLRIETAPGKGTRTILRLPLTLAIVQVLLVEVRGQIFGLPVSHVTHTMKVDPGQVEWSQKRAVVRWGKEIVHLEDLSRLVGLEPRDLSSGDSFHAVLVERAGRELAGLAVEGLAGAYEAVIKPLGPPLKHLRGLAGATVMGDGRTVLVLDVKALL